MNLVIRPATEADYDEVARVWTRSFFFQRIRDGAV